MTYQEGRAALQLLAEREVGIPRRAYADQENAREDRSLAALKAEQEGML